MQQSSRSVKKKKKFGKFLTGFVIIATLAGELGGTIIHEVQNYFEDYTYDDSDSYTEDDPYSDLQEVMPLSWQTVRPAFLILSSSRPETVPK